MSPNAHVEAMPDVLRRIAVWLSAIAVLSAAVASGTVVRILGTQTPPRAVLWLGLMVALTATGVYGAKSRRAAVVWATTGGVVGFVAIASASIGVFFALAALLLFAAAVASSIDERAGWRTLWMPVYLFGGATAIATVTLLMAVLQSSVIS